MLTIAGVLAAIAATPAGATKPTTPGAGKPATAKVPSASRQCRTERSQMGRDTFRLTYGTNHNRSNAFGECVSERNAATRAARKAARGDRAKTARTVKHQVRADVNAAKACKTERKADKDAFNAKYGTNANHRNAFGKCVSTTAKAQAHS